MSTLPAIETGEFKYLIETIHSGISKKTKARFVELAMNINSMSDIQAYEYMRECISKNNAKKYLKYKKEATLV